MSRCSTKQRYRDRIAAELALSRIQYKTPREKDLKRAYKCPHCKKWHLTSQELREKR